MKRLKEMFTLSTKKIAGMAVLTALAVALSLIIHIPIFPAVAFLEYDMADIPIFLGAFMYGPFAGFIMTIVVAVIQGVTVSAGGGWIGIVMHIFATGLYVIVAGTIYYFHRNIKGALVAMASGIAVWMIGMILWNILLTPLYMGVPRDAVISLLGYIAAFNAIKVGANSLATLLLYKRLRHLFEFVARKAAKSRIDKKKKSNNNDAIEVEDEGNANHIIKDTNEEKGVEEDKA